MNFREAVFFSWGFLVFLVRGTCVALADFWIQYVRVGKTWKHKAVPAEKQLAVQLTEKSPTRNTVRPEELDLIFHDTLMDQQLQDGLSSAGAVPSALVTGVSCGGIGFYTTLYLLLSGVNVHAVFRNAQGSVPATQLLQKAVDHHCQQHQGRLGKVGRIMRHHCDLSDTAAVATLADKIYTDPNLRILICNAGPMATPIRLSPQNLEEQFAVHHVGHSLLVLRLLQKRLSSSPSHRGVPWRIIFLSSGAASTAYPDAMSTFHEWKSVSEASQHLNRFDNYGNAKMCELLFGLALSKCIAHDPRLSGCCTCNVLHPGPIRSRVLSNSALPLQWMIDGDVGGLLRMTPAIAGLFVTDLALNRRHARTNGHFYRMGEDQSERYVSMVTDPRACAGFWRNSTLFPGIPGPSVSLSYERQFLVMAMYSKLLLRPQNC